MPSVFKTCVQVVCSYMNNEWVQLPQDTQNLWTNLIRPTHLSPLTRVFLRFMNYIPTTLCAAKIRAITDIKSYLSTLSTPPTITTTIYI